MPSHVPNLGQIALILASAALFLAGWLISLGRLWRNNDGLRVAAKACQWTAVTAAVGVIVWHARARGSWLPLEDNFEALTWIAVLLSLFVLYVQRTRPIGGLDWFILPFVILMLIAAAAFGRAEPNSYRVYSTWTWLHLLSSFGGAAAFCVAGAVGAMYLLVSARLRRKNLPPTRSLGSLERLEGVTQMAITLGFALLTIGLITGLVKVLSSSTALGPRWYSQPKVVLAFAGWVVYALALHTPMTPSFRGRKAAILSIVGLVLMFGTLVAVQFNPGGNR